MRSFFVLQRGIGRSALLLLATALAALVWLSPAGAATTTCTGTTNGETIEGNLIVPAGVECVLLASQVNGSVIVLPGGSLALASCFLSGCEPVAQTRISGNVIATGAGFVSMNGSLIEGNLVVSESDFVFLLRAMIEGTLTLTGNDLVVFILGHIGGNLVCTNNGSVVGALTVEGQSVGQCSDAQ
jgi:hypothetical protein